MTKKHLKQSVEISDAAARIVGTIERRAVSMRKATDAWREARYRLALQIRDRDKQPLRVLAMALGGITNEAARQVYVDAQAWRAKEKP